MTQRLKAGRGGGSFVAFVSLHQLWNLLRLILVSGCENITTLTLKINLFYHKLTIYCIKSVGLQVCSDNGCFYYFFKLTDLTIFEMFFSLVLVYDRFILTGTTL